ncbi:MAG: DNA repair protein RecN [Clostridiales bacterium]|nr:DNA repair protein RecN [Clostridiales bacterium]
MLVSLHIKNIAVIDEVSVEFGGGFNVMTGETGAGKSIVIDAINMVLGQRANKELIRNGEKKAVVEALFYIDEGEALSALEDMGIPADDGNLLIYRDLNTEGRGNSRVNGSIVTAGMVKELSRLLINIHGQQDNQSLLTPASHAEYLDSYAGLRTLRQRYGEAFSVTRGIEKQLRECQTDAQEKLRNTDLLRYQMTEIEDARLKDGEEEALAERREFLGSAGKITAVIEEARGALYTNESFSVHDVLSRVVSGFGEVSRYDERLSRFYETLSGISIDLDEIIYQIRDYADGMEFDPAELDAIEERMDLIHKLKRKYGAGIGEIRAYYDKISAELDGILQSDVRAEELQAALAVKRELRDRLASELTEKRAAAARTLEKKITDELADLDMNRVSFRVDLQPSDYTAAGADSVEFLISTNAGEPLKPLAKIASGGEMSRIMLAIKSVLADTDSVPTLIFDEIDTGVSGRAAQKIAQKIDKIARKKQILCITHLAQIASMAGTHFIIEKGMTDDATKTEVTRLSDRDRVSELARIIGGARITELTLRNAGEMLQLAEAYKSAAG